MDKAGPRTCESIKANFGTYCNGCSEHVTSPIVLGRPYARRTENCRPVGFDDCAPPSISPDILPGILRAFPLALSESIQVPYELALINALGAVAVAAQRKFRVMSPEGRRDAAFRRRWFDFARFCARCPLHASARNGAGEDFTQLITR